MAKVEQRHRDAAFQVYSPNDSGPMAFEWVGWPVVERIAQALADAEARGAESPNPQSPSSTASSAMGDRATLDALLLELRNLADAWDGLSGSMSTSPELHVIAKGEAYARMVSVLRGILKEYALRRYDPSLNVQPEPSQDGRELWVIENRIGAIKNHDINEHRMRRGCLDHEGERVVRYVPEGAIPSQPPSLDGDEASELRGHPFVRCGQCRGVHLHKMSCSWRSMPLPPPPKPEEGTNAWKATTRCLHYANGFGQCVLREKHTGAHSYDPNDTEKRERFNEEP